LGRRKQEVGEMKLELLVGGEPLQQPHQHYEELCQTNPTTPQALVLSSHFKKSGLVHVTCLKFSVFEGI
jgi:hypothetical protein